MAYNNEVIMIARESMLDNPYELYHHGIKSQKWGVRRYQNEDGSLTSEGRKRYLNYDGSLNKKGTKALQKQLNKETQRANKAKSDLANATKTKMEEKLRDMKDELSEISNDNLKKYTHDGAKTLKKLNKAYNDSFDEAYEEVVGKHKVMGLDITDQVKNEFRGDKNIFLNQIPSEKTMKNVESYMKNFRDIDVDNIDHDKFNERFFDPRYDDDRHNWNMTDREWKENKMAIIKELYEDDPTDEFFDDVDWSKYRKKK